MSSSPIIQLDDVSLCYRLARQKVASIKEYFIHFIKGSLTYEQLWALQGVNLQIGRGEAVGVLGPNGAGKSTMAKVISGILRPTTGQCHVRGRVSPILELGLGFDYELTGIENIYLNALLLGRRRSEVTDKIDEIIEFSGLPNFVESPVRNYSSGMLARLGFSIATAWVPDVLILDEVLAVGDVRFLDRCRERIEQFRSQGSTLIVVSHSIEMLLDYSTRCVWLEKGQIVADGEPREIVDRYMEHMHRPRDEAAQAAEDEPSEPDPPSATEPAAEEAVASGA